MDPKITVMPMSKVVSYPRLVDDIVNCFIAVYNAVGDGEWGENWTPDTARQRLFGDASKIGDYTYVTIMHKGVKTVGFTVTLVGPLNQVITASEMPPGYTTDESADMVRKGIRAMVGSENPVVLVYRDIGVVSRHRGGLAIAGRMLMKISSELNGVDFVWGGGWTVRTSKLFALLKHFGATVVHDFGDEEGHVFQGDHLPEFWERMREFVDDSR